MGEKVYSQSEMEMQVSIARVETLISVSRDDFNVHKIDDEKNFDEIHKANRVILKHIDEEPARMMSCKSELEEDISEKVNKGFVNKDEFVLYTSKFKWIMGSATILATILAWIAHLTMDLIKAGVVQ